MSSIETLQTSHTNHKLYVSLGLDRGDYIAVRLKAVFNEKV